MAESRPSLFVRLEFGVIMKSKDSRKCTEARSLCADLHADDGLPNSRRKETRDDCSNDRKTMQLCAQVRRSLHGIIPLPGSSFFEGLVVEAVKPDPNATRLRVVISVPISCAHSIPLLNQRLTDMVGFMRSEVASQINRKRVPMLTFEFIPREDTI